MTSLKYQAEEISNLMFGVYFYTKTYTQINNNKKKNERHCKTTIVSSLHSESIVRCFRYFQSSVLGA